jgi:hypothetical protein
MHERTSIRLSAADRSELETVAANRNSPRKHVWRAKIVLKIPVLRPILSGNFQLSCHSLRHRMMAGLAARRYDYGKGEALIEEAKGLGRT